MEQKLNCWEIFSRLDFLFVLMCGYSAMMPDPELDFMLPTDISIAMWMHVHPHPPLNFEILTKTL